MKRVKFEIVDRGGEGWLEGEVIGDWGRDQKPSSRSFDSSRDRHLVISPIYILASLILSHYH